MGKIKERRSLADEVASRVKPYRRLTWIDRLDADAQEEVLDTRKRFQAGFYGSQSAASIAAVMIEIAAENGWRFLSEKEFARWLLGK